MHGQQDPEIWTKDVWNSIFQRLSNDMPRDSVPAQAIHPFLTIIKMKFTRPAPITMTGLMPLLSTIYIQTRVCALFVSKVVLHEYQGHITRAQKLDMQTILEYDFD